MKTMLKRFWKNEQGFVVTVEMILIATILVIGLVTGLQVLRDAVVSELADTAQAIGAANQSWNVGAIDDGLSAGSAGMSFTDAGEAGLDQTAQADLLVGGGVAVTITPSAGTAIAGGNLQETDSANP